MEVRDGRLSLIGALEADDLLYEDAVIGVVFNAERVALRASSWSFVRKSVPQIDDFELKGATLRIVRGEGPAGEPARELNEERPMAFRLLPVAVERARFEDVTVILEEGARRITGRIAAALDGVGPGRSGNVTLQAGFLVEHGGTPALSGTMAVNLPVQLARDGTTHDMGGIQPRVVRAGSGSLEPTDPEV